MVVLDDGVDGGQTEPGPKADVLRVDTRINPQFKA
jgi:hypothetical protein